MFNTTMLKCIAITFFMFIATTNTYAVPMYQLSTDNSNVYIGAASSAEIAYDANSDQFSGIFGGNDYDVYDSTGTIFQLSGTFTVDATINEDGVLSSGNVSWIGGGDGIALGTNLLQGNLTEFSFLEEPPAPFDNLTEVNTSVFNFLVDVTLTDPILNLADTLLLQLFFSDAATGNPFTASFASSTPFSGQNLLGVTAFKVPEPASISLFLLGIIGLGLVHRRKSLYRIKNSPKNRLTKLAIA